MNRALILLFCISVCAGCGGKEKAKKPAGNNIPDAAESAEPLAAGPQEKANTPPDAALAEQIHNPFLTEDEEALFAAVGKAVLLSHLRLSGILFSPLHKSKAIINGLILEKGDRVDNKEIIDIQPELVILKDAKTEYLVKLKE